AVVAKASTATANTSTGRIVIEPDRSDPDPVFTCGAPDPAGSVRKDRAGSVQQHRGEGRDLAEPDRTIGPAGELVVVVDVQARRPAGGDHRVRYGRRSGRTEPLPAVLRMNP